MASQFQLQEAIDQTASENGWDDDEQILEAVVVALAKYLSRDQVREFLGVLDAVELTPGADEDEDEDEEEA